MTTAELAETKAAAITVGPFDEALFDGIVAAGEPQLIRAKREEALAAYASMATPTTATEEWRRTDPGSFPFDKVTATPLLSAVDAPGAHAWDSAFDVVVTVSDEGYSITDRKGVLGDRKVQVLPLAEAAGQLPELLTLRMQGEALPAGADKFAALNQAFWNVGFCVHVPDDTTLENGILFRYEHERDGSAVVPRLLVVLGARSKATVAERYASPDDATILAVTTKELYVGEGGNLSLISVQEWGDKTYLIDNGMGRVERDGTLEWLTLNFGTRVSKLKFGSDVAGPGSRAELDGIFFATGDQHLDQKTLQMHSSPHTYSRLLYKGAVKDRGQSVYQGIIRAKPGAIDVDSYQTNNNLVLNDGARAHTIPGLLIDADDLKCSHGATIGNVDEEQVFYLRSRGLNDHDARKLVIMGYFEEIVDRIPFEIIRDRVHEQIEEKLGELA
jgi:Fe-S cluster assembly protein SufD